MRKFISILFSFLLTFTTGVFLYAPAHAERPLVIAGDHANYPACAIDELGELVGYNLDVVREAAKRAGISVKIELMPWKRVLFSLENGSVGAGLPLFVTDERKEFALYTSTPLHIAYMGAYTLRDNAFEYEGLHSLFNKRVGMNLGFSISQEFDAASKAGKFITYGVGTTEQLFRMLKLDRIDVAVTKHTLRNLLVSKTGLKTVEIGAVNEGEPAYLVFSKQADIPNKQRVLAQFNTALAEMERDGTIKRMIKAYDPK